MIVCHPPGPEVMDFVARRMPAMFGDSIKYAGEYAATAVVDEAGHIVAGIIFNDYMPQFGTIMVHLAADTPRWATHNVVRAVLHYPFMQLRVNKVWGATPANLTRVLRFNRGIGFTQEAVLGQHYGQLNAVITRMLAKDYKKFYLDEGGRERLALIRSSLRKEERDKARLTSVPKAA